MNYILLSGGSGTRLWPLSNTVRAKQFLKIFPTENGNRESMVQRMHRMINEVDNKANILIATSEEQIPSIKLQLGDDVNISIEPCRRDTFPAIALAAAYLHDVMNIGTDEPVVVCPVDPHVDINYFLALRKLGMLAGEANLTLMGIKPTYPTEKYGYILPNGKFTEKPDVERAKELIAQGAMWNGGVFAFKLRYMMEKTNELCGNSSYNYLYNEYANLPKISFDYAVAEKENSIKVLEFSGLWQDLGTWNALSDALIDEVAGNVVKSEDCVNTHVINELSIPVVVLGADNLAVVCTPDGILVADKDDSSRLKEYIPTRRPMYEKRFWGEYKVLDYVKQADGKNSLTKHLIIWPEHNISYQKHNDRDEMWTFTEGNGTLVINGERKKVSRGDYVYIPAGTRHAIRADGENLHIIEVQIGNKLDESEIERFEYDWN